MSITAQNIKDLIVDICGIDPSIITPEATFKETMQMDSLNIADLIASLEEDYGVIVNQEDALQIRTFGQLMEYVGREKP